MQQSCDDAWENVQESKGKPTEALYAVCGPCVTPINCLACIPISLQDEHVADYTAYLVHARMAACHL